MNHVTGTLCTAATIDHILIIGIECKSIIVDFSSLFKAAVAKFVLNIPNCITKFGILRGNLLSQICKLLN